MPHIRGIQFKSNDEKAKACHGCRWLHIGYSVDHNHCDNSYFSCGDKRANGHVGFVTDRCGYSEMTAESMEMLFLMKMH